MKSTRTIWGRLLSAGALLASLALVGGRWDYTADDTRAALDTASSRATCVVGYETGWTFDPNLIGRAGEIGPVQLHPRGRLADFYARGYDDPWSPYQAVAYLDGELAAGRGSAWTPVLYGYC